MWEKKNSTDTPKHQQGKKKKAFVKMVWNVIHYLIKTLLYHRFIRFPAGCHKLCTLVLNHFKLFLQPIDLLLEPLEE